MTPLVDLDDANGTEATLACAWPILDPATPLSDLLGQAQAELVGWLRGSGWSQAAPVEWSIGREFRGTRPGMTLTARLELARRAVA